MTCNNTFRTWAFRIGCALLAGATCWFVADKGAALVWHYQLLLWQQILVAVAPGTLTLFLPKTRELANWTVGCMDIPTANAVLAAKGNARVNTGARPATTGSAPKRPLPGRVAVPAPAVVNKQPTAPVAPAPAEKQMKTLVENDKVSVAVSEPENGIVTISVTASNMSNSQVKNENSGLFPLVRKVAGAKWEHHKSIGDKRKRISGTCPADQLDAVVANVTEIAKRFGK